jgi:hypothetical protein
MALPLHLLQPAKGCRAYSNLVNLGNLAAPSAAAIQAK